MITKKTINYKDGTFITVHVNKLPDETTRRVKENFPDFLPSKTPALYSIVGVYSEDGTNWYVYERVRSKDVEDVLEDIERKFINNKTEST